MNAYLKLFKLVFGDKLFWLLQIAILPTLCWFEFWSIAEICIVAVYFSIFLHEAIHILVAGKYLRNVNATSFWIEIETEKLPTGRALLSTASPLLVAMVGFKIYEITGNLWLSFPFILHVFLLPIDLANLFRGLEIC